MTDQLTSCDYLAMALLAVCIVSIVYTDYKRRHSFISLSEWRQRMRKQNLGGK